MDDRKMNIYKRILVFLAAALMIGCAHDDCRKINELVEMESTRVELLRWVDENVFSRKFDWNRDFQRFPRYLGPGRDGGMIDLDRSGIRLPNILSGYYLWTIGPDGAVPDAILLGVGSYKGIVVTKGEFYESLKAVDGLAEYVDHKFDRLGVLCVNRD